MALVIVSVKMGYYKKGGTCLPEKCQVKRESSLPVPRPKGKRTEEAAGKQAFLLAEGSSKEHKGMKRYEIRMRFRRSG
jgi:hypothetical protein